MTARATAGVEYRTIPTGEVAAADNGTGLNGVAVRFGSPTQIGDPSWGFREEFAAGAFTKTLSESDVVLLDNHDTARPIARKSAGTLTLRQADALHWDAEPTSEASYINDVRANILAKNYGGCSFGFQAVKEDWLDDSGNPSDATNGTQRVVREAKLYEVSVCTFPAYGDTEVSARDAVTAAREARAAKATYADLDTCGDCGDPNQWGSFCTNCGEAMSSSKPAGQYCQSCGSDLSSERSHLCGEKRDDNKTSSDAVERSEDIPKPDDSTSGIDMRKIRFRLESTRRATV
jgi:HK97 family phage prohead protease